jgi:hypothetical protein
MNNERGYIFRNTKREADTLAVPVRFFRWLSLGQVWEEAIEESLQ